MKITIDEKRPRIGLEEDARGIVVVCQQQEGPAGPLVARSEYWSGSDSTLGATGIVRELLEELRRAEPASLYVSELDELVLATARAQGGERLADEIARNLTTNGIFAAEILADGTVDMRVSTMFADLAICKDLLEDVLFSARCRASLKTILPEVLPQALAAELSKVQIATSMPKGRPNGRG